MTRNHTIKATARIDEELYNRVSKKFHQGGLTHLFRKVFLVLDHHIETDTFSDVISWIYDKNQLDFTPLNKEIPNERL